MLLIFFAKETRSKREVMSLLVMFLMMVIYVSVAFEVDRRKRICIGTGRRYTYKKRIPFKRRCARLRDTLLFRT